MSGKPELTEMQKARIEKNRQKALLLKKSHLVVHPYSKGPAVKIDKSIIKIGSTQYKDTGGGFLLRQEQDKEDMPIIASPEDAPLIEPDRPNCETCKKVIEKSWLFDTFDCKVCDECKDPEMHKLITKTEAMKEYLLKDIDFDKRFTPLKYITRKNPHNVMWGDMKLFLQIQVEQRALDIWGSEEKIEKELEKREENKIMLKTKKYEKEMKKLRMSTRSSLYDRTTKASHTHEFGEETYNEDEDTYTHSCTICKYEETFEKM